jgi:hypothetical protein
MKQSLWLTLVTCLAYCVDKELWKAIDYLKEQVGVLKEQQEKNKRILLNDQQRTRPAEDVAGDRRSRDSLQEGESALGLHLDPGLQPPEITRVTRG